MARHNADLFNRAAGFAEIRGVCVLSDGSTPYQPFIGRGEALEALHQVLSGHAEGWLSEHDRECRRLCELLLGGPVPGPESLRPVLDDLLALHGCPSGAFDERVSKIRAEPSTLVRSVRDGFLGWDLELIRDVLVRLQRGPARSGLFCDAAGVTLLKRPGTQVFRGEALMRVRGQELDQAAGALGKAIRVSARAPGGQARFPFEAVS